MKDKVLYISAFNPFSPIGGGNQRCFNLLKVLCERYAVDVVIDFDKFIPDSICKYRDVKVLNLETKPTPIVSRIIHRLKSIMGLIQYERFLIPSNLSRAKSLHILLKQNEYKFVIIRYIYMISYYRLYDVGNMILDIDDLPTQKFQSELLFNNQFLTKKEKKKLKQLSIIQKKIAEKALISFLPDKKHLHYFNNCHYLPNIPIEPHTDIIRRPSTKIIFVGSMNQNMNYNGVDHFVTNIWPHIFRKHSDFEFHIIGKGTPNQYVQKWKKIHGVKLRGFVDDLFAEYMQAYLAVTPIYNGAGTNIKVLESLTYKCPVVVTRFAYRGFENILIPGKDILIADSDIEFISVVNFLIENHYIAEEIANNGHLVVKKEYTMRELSNCFYKAIDSLSK